MIKLRYIFISILLFFYIVPVLSQTIDGLKDIVSFQQEKISRIEDNLKKVVGLIEEQSKLKGADSRLKLLEKEIKETIDNVKLIENKIKNITNLAYDLEFALKRVERHLQLSSLKSGQDNINITKNNDKNDYKIKKKVNVEKNSLQGKTNGVLGFVKEDTSKDNQTNEILIDKKLKDDKKEIILPSGTVEDNFNFALDLANQLDFINAEKALKEFLTKHKESNRTADAKYWLGRVYFAQKKFEEATIALSEFNITFPNDPRYQETTLLIAESAVNFAPQDKLCNILKQLSENMVNPSEKFLKKIKFFKNDKQCFPE